MISPKNMLMAEFVHKDFCYLALISQQSALLLNDKSFKGCVSLDPSKILKSGWWGLQLDTWQLCNSLWYGLINSKLHINKKIFIFISHNIRRCHTSNVLNHPAASQGWTWPLTPADLHTLLGKPARRDIVPKFLKDHCYFLYPLPTKWNKYCVSSVLIPNDCQCSSKQL